MPDKTLVVLLVQSLHGLLDPLADVVWETFGFGNSSKSESESLLLSEESELVKVVGHLNPGISDSVSESDASSAGPEDSDSSSSQ